MGRLKGVPSILSPDLLHLLASTGHGDRIVLADINFPTGRVVASCDPAHRPLLLRADGLSIRDLLDAILELMPLDTYQQHQMTMMALEPCDRPAPNSPRPASADHYCGIAKRHGGDCFKDKPLQVQLLERAQYYDYAKTAQAIVQTGDRTPYANVCLNRGVC